MTKLKISVGGFDFIGELEETKAPETCCAFRQLLPLENKLIHGRWSGDAMWIPYGDTRLGLEYENQTSFPAKGEFLLYPGGITEMELVVSYGKCLFSSEVGQLAGNHFMTLVEGAENLEALGHKVLWEGAQVIRIDYFDENL